jgi:hypothetical protein
MPRDRAIAVNAMDAMDAMSAPWLFLPSYRKLVTKYTACWQVIKGRDGNGYLTAISHGLTDAKRAITKGSLVLTGDRKLAGSVQGWLGLSAVASLVKRGEVRLLDERLRSVVLQGLCRTA